MNPIKCCISTKTISPQNSPRAGSPLRTNPQGHIPQGSTVHNNPTADNNPLAETRADDNFRPAQAPQPR